LSDVAAAAKAEASPGDGGSLPRRRRAEKNSENFRILQSHNLLSARCLQKAVESSIYNNAEIRKAAIRNYSG
jgi:hypothetical protein